MTYRNTFSKLSTIFDQFNDTLNNSNKLDNAALKTIQNYLNDPQVTLLDEKDKEKMQRHLRQLESLTHPSTLTRIRSIDIKQINRQLIRLADLLKKNSEQTNKNSEQTNKNSYFIIVKLEVRFHKILSAEAINSSKEWQKFYEEKMNINLNSKSSHPTLHPHALRMDRQLTFYQ
ncbi:unnamed protein product [Rotaria sp. Silwood2]|nr:unnamed protein product [Rotaria sp. Silwood2]CAF4613861.1 unnamed protein product [Rotaria sp. Silwood2]